MQWIYHLHTFLPIHFWWIPFIEKSLQVFAHIFWIAFGIKNRLIWGENGSQAKQAEWGREREKHTKRSKKIDKCYCTRESICVIHKIKLFELLIFHWLCIHIECLMDFGLLRLYAAFFSLARPKKNVGMNKMVAKVMQKQPTLGKCGVFSAGIFLNDVERSRNSIAHCSAS